MSLSIPHFQKKAGFQKLQALIRIHLPSTGREGLPGSVQQHCWCCYNSCPFPYFKHCIEHKIFNKCIIKGTFSSQEEDSEGTSGTKYFSVAAVSLQVGAGALRKTEPIFMHSLNCH